MSTPYYDGDWTVATQTGPTVRSRDKDSFAHIFKKRFQIRRDYYRPLAMDVPIDEAFAGETFNTVPFLVDESDPVGEDCGILSWERTFAELPNNRNEWIGYVHNSQYKLTIDGSVDILEYARVTTARVRYDYFHTTAPENISYNRAYKLVKIGSTVYSTGGADPGYNVERVAEDSTIERWNSYPHSNVYVRKTLYVNQPSITILP